MIRKIPAAEVVTLTAQVEAQHGPGWVYHHTVEGIGPDGRQGRVDVFSNDHRDWDQRKTIHVLDGRVLEPW